MKTKRELRFPLDLQMFAEGQTETNENGESGGATPPKTYSVEEYNKLKSSFDKASSELANLKKDFKARQTDEEKQVEAQKEKDDLLASLQRENQSMKIAKELAVGGFDEKTIENITNDIVEGNMENLTKTLVALRKSMTEEITKQAKVEFQRTNKLPNNGGSEEDNSIGARLGKEQASVNKAREFYANRK